MVVLEEIAAGSTGAGGPWSTAASRRRYAAKMSLWYTTAPVSSLFVLKRNGDSFVELKPVMVQETLELVRRLEDILELGRMLDERLELAILAELFALRRQLDVVPFVKTEPMHVRL